VGNGLSRYLTLPVVPTLLGYDPRLQFIFDEDAVGALVEAVDLDLRGVVNVAAPGQLYLSRVLRLGRRVEQPLPKRGWRAARRGLAATGIHLSAADARLLQYGRVMDISLATSAYASPPSLNCRQSVLALYGRLPQKASS
jgi:UDP-glucose 4-epimerase